MRIIRAIQKTDWRAAWWAMRVFIEAMGAIILASWFAAQRQFLIIGPAALLLSATWYLIYKIRSLVHPAGLTTSKQEAGAPPNRQKPAPAPAIVEPVAAAAPAELQPDPDTTDVVSALVNLGYKPRVAQRAVVFARLHGAKKFEGMFSAAQKALAMPRGAQRQ
jgi:RuvA, C-terminal domain